ncbi:MAG: putative rane protein [Clostridiales bacterium]|jgi:ATP-binding cassette subfamily B protein|nr:putative rane protein [Clostridiales bacterium]
MVFSVTLDMVSPRVKEVLVDKVLKEGKYDLLKWIILAVVIITIGRAVSGYFKELVFDIAGVNMCYRLRKDLFKHIQGLSYRFFDRSNTGELMARIKDDAEKIWYAASFGIMLTVEVIFHSIFLVIMMVSISPLLSIIAFVTMPIIGYIAMKLEKDIGQTYEDISEQNAEMNVVAQENLSGVRLVKAFAREKFEIGKFLKKNEVYYDLNMKQTEIIAKYNPAIQYITKILPAIVILFGGIMVINKSISLGKLVAFVAYVDMIVWPMEMIGWLTSSMTEAAASNKKLRKIANEKSEIIEVENPVEVEKVEGTIEFRNVSLELNDTSILEDISFKVEKGKTIGIMGNTGSGKSSLINLLVRFYDTTKGEILLDGVNIKEYKLKDLRANIALVMQDVFLFSDSIEENIRLGGSDQISDADMEEAARISGAKEFIEKLEKKYKTVIGERGIGLSGGQKQRISIARAIAKKSPIIVFDDSTSALDMETEKKIQHEIGSMKGITQIVVAHRISAVRNADEIIVLKRGQIVERGTHDELMKLQGRYFRTFNEQYEGFFE